VSYGTLDRAILSSSLLDHGPLAVAFMALIVADKDKFGITTLNPRTMAKLLRIPMSEAEKGWLVLVSEDPASSNPEAGGRRLVPYAEGWEGWSAAEIVGWKGKWRVVSHEKYQREHSVERKRERDAESQRRRRERVGPPAEVCSVCGGGPVEGAVTGEFRCKEHWPEEAGLEPAAGDDDEGPI
jgi:hypothetical protein